MGTSYTSDQWQRAIRISNSSTKSINLWELNQKIVLRWYLTPYRISKFSPQASPLCWRRCGLVGTLFHILWECPVIRPVWEEIFSLAARVTGVEVPLSPGLAVLSLGLEFFSKTNRAVISHILMSTRLAITRHWRDHTAPTMREIITTTSTHIDYERMFAASQGRAMEAHGRWRAWTEWFSEI